MQEGRASRAFETLRDLQERNATVIRDGQKYIVDAKDLVPGDIIFIESGDAYSRRCPYYSRNRVKRE